MGNKKAAWQIEAFREAIDACSLHDLGFEGYRFSWQNGRSGDTNVQVQLDRFCGNSEWLNDWPQTSVSYLVSSYSDHCPILLETCKVEKIGQNEEKEHPYKFEKM